MSRSSSACGGNGKWVYARRMHAYTLVEMLIAVIMFALITVATGFMMSGGMRGQQKISEKASDAQEARALLSTITRDLRSLFAVTGSPATYFVASGADSGPILQFTTLASRIIPDPVVDSHLGSFDSESLVPQSDNMQVTYDYDPSTHVLSRLVSRLPGVETLPEIGGPEWILSRRVGYIAFTFYDADGNTRTEWNYQTPQTDTTTSYDTTVPARIGVEIDLDRPNGETLVLTTTIVPANTALQPAGQKPASAQTSTGGGTGGGGTGGGGGGGGG